MTVKVLLVEDSPGDVRLTLEVFRDASFDVHLSVAADGVEAMAFLRREGAYANAPPPRSHSARFEPTQDGWSGSSCADQARQYFNDDTYSNTQHI